ncbi:hypothetical protein PDK06_25315 [Bacillus cereus group sp. TH217LC]|uniref:hypothetical protein n=1 Tax=Bacillus cereus group TaxID=86661 RepID=UPI000942B7B8|nr:hypothetical protein [Bacillus cereus group sp. TH217LC]MDA1598128.1 hypothetical protein [Bacillus cereus group sp. TH217LC]
MNTPNLSNIVKQDVLAELRKGNTDVLKGLPPVLAMQYGLALQNEAGGYIEESQIKDTELNEAMLNRMKDSGVKERLIKEIEAEEKAHADKIAIAKQITKEVTGE